tara:strand:+ start:238 stop:546 length:309 start_codon:yes stop_codon:yes gene_type:complete
MIGKLDPEERVMNEPNVHEQIDSLIKNLKWETGDNIVVEMAGTQVSGIDVGEEYNKKWQSPIGTRKYNKDAFIVIKNLSRSPFEPSVPNSDLKQQHEYTGGK